MKTYLERIILLLIVFYYTYPQALNTFGSSFIILPGMLGLGLYAYHKFPFKEVVYVALAYSAFVFIVFFTSYINMYYDEFLFGYTKSQVAWFFSAYIIIFLLFKFHDRPTPITVASYLVGAVALQCFCTVLIKFNPGALEFFSSLELQSEITQEIRDEVEGTRLIGYGIGFFGAGFIAGYGLIFSIFILARAKLKKSGIFFMTIVYVFIFYIGVFSARTTIVGAAVSMCLLLLFYIKDYRSLKSKMSTFGISLIFLLIIGSSICYVYFPSMADWAFELFTNFSKKGKLETSSSNGIEGMIFFPEDFRTFIIGSGSLKFAGSDVGYTRISHLIGIVGMCIFYGYAMFVARVSFSKDWHTNMLLISIVIYGLALNIKGLTDMHSVLYLFFFYFMYYKYYRFLPRVYQHHAELISQRQ